MVLQRTGTVVNQRTMASPNVPVPKKPTIKSRLAQIRDTSGFNFSKYFDYASSVLLDTTFVMFFILSAYLCFNYTTKGESSHLVKFVKNFVNHFPSFADSECTILGLILVAVPFIPAIFTVSASNRAGAVFCTIAYYVFVPERTVYEYLIHGAIVYLILRTNVKQFRVIGLVLLFLSYIMQFTVPLPSGKGYSVCNNTTAE
ncbi:membrane-associated protein [Uxmal virus]|uniref:Membrane-associated protein n=1 Tax=Uxmal virus TaxID=2488578 RepID=A0A3G5BMM4_9VIRU|nr:membrane-associated protein [Uxmal virus]